MDTKIIREKLSVFRGTIISDATIIERALGWRLRTYFFSKTSQQAADFCYHIVETPHFGFDKKISLYGAAWASARVIGPAHDGGVGADGPGGTIEDGDGIEVEVADSHPVGALVGAEVLAALADAEKRVAIEEGDG